MKTARKLVGIEYFRVAAAFLVVAIHCSPLLTYSETADFIFTRVIARAAVPFFFMVTGYFVIGKPEKTRKFLKKTGIIYLASILLYLPLNLYAGNFKGLTPGAALTQLLFEGTFYHLWYLPAALLGVLVASLLARSRAGLGIAGALYLLGLLGDSYWGLVSGVPVVSDVYNVIFSVAGYTRNGLFFAPLFLLLGAAMRGDRLPGRGVSAAGLAAAFALMLAEALLLRRLGWQRHDSMYVFLPAVMYFLFALLLIPRGRAAGWMAPFSLLVYILHPWVIVLVRGAARVAGLWGPLVENSVGHYLAVCLGTAAAAAVILLVWRRIRPVRPDDRGRAWVEVDSGALRQNAEALRSILPRGCELMAVLKCEAYGHGAVKAARLLNGCGVRAFAVACAAEGVQLRRAGVRGVILVLGWTAPESFECLARYRLTQTVTEPDYARALSAFGWNIDVHIKIDTGMHRLGTDPGDIVGIEEIFSLPHLRVTGMYTHLCVSDSLSAESRSFTEGQVGRFFALADVLRRDGYDPGKLHTQSSYGLLNYPDARCAYARVGIALYGVKSSAGDDVGVWPGLVPALSLKARVEQVRSLPAGSGLGYGLAYTTARASRIAVLPIGYGDGFPRGCEGAEVLVNGHRAPVIGRVCMDQLFVDVTDCGEVRPGDTVVLIGPGLPCEELAGHCGTISNEILSRLGKRLPRVWQ